MISVKLCDLSACVGDEKGCNSSECKNPKWHRWPRKQFKEIFDREPHGYQFMEKQKVK